MHHLIQRGKLRSQVVNVPEGLPELLSDITREVLRCQPTTECLCQFIIDYLCSVIAARDKARIAKSIIDRALFVVDNVIADMCICDIPKDKADRMCEMMEQCFRRFLAQRRCEKGKDKEIIKFNEFDMLDELIQKCKFTSEELKVSKPVIEAAYKKFLHAYMSAKDTCEGTDSLYQYFRDREIKRMEDASRVEAATKIQAYFRGFLVRNSMFMNEPIKPRTSISSEAEHEKMQLEMAARKIQQFFRHHISVVNTSNNLQDPCTPSSKLSITARPSDHHDIIQDKENTNDIRYVEEHDDAIPKERVSDVQNIEDEPNNIDVIEDVAVDQEITNNDLIEDNQYN